jgi:hypothetical protein
MTNHKNGSMELFTLNYVHGARTLWKLVCNKLLKISPFMRSQIPLLYSQVNPFHTVLSFVIKLYFNIILVGVPSDIFPLEDLCLTGSPDITTVLNLNAV